MRFCDKNRTAPSHNSAWRPPAWVSFDFGPNANKLVRIGHNGNVEAQKDFGGAPLLGLGFAAGKVYILNFGASKLQRIDPNFTATTAVEDVATIPSIGTPGSRTAGSRGRRR